LPATVPGTGLAVVDFGDAAGAGMEGLSMSEQLTPFVKILQKGSPEVDPSAPGYLEAARPGMLMNTATGELYPGKEGIEVVVCARDYHYGKWVPRDSGGGFRGFLRPEDPIVLKGLAKYGKFAKIPHVTDDGEAVELIETIQLYVLYAEKELDEQSAKRAIISFTSTALQVAKTYLTKHNSWVFLDKNDRRVVAPIYQYRWNFSLVPQQNNSGSWFTWKIERVPPSGPPVAALIPRTNPLYQAAEEFYNLFEAGQVKADYGDSANDQDVPPF